jgi:hypothetical protein
MEQPVWLFFGIVAVLIGLGIIIHVVYLNEEDSIMRGLRQSLDKLEGQCNFVCAAGEETYLSIRAELPTKARIFTHKQNICGEVGDDLSYCVQCNCEMEPYELSLNTTLAEKFKVHHYNCFFEKMDPNVRMECLG